MVGVANPSPTPGTGVEARPAREAPAVGRIGEAIEERPAAAPEAAAPWSAARANVRSALLNLDLTLAAAREALRTLGRIEEAAEMGDGAGVVALVAQLHEGVDRAIKAGAEALTGAPVRTAVERDAPPFEIPGMDLRLKTSAEPDDALRLSRASLAADAGTAARQARDSVGRVRDGCERLERAAQRLQAHDGFLALAESGAPSSVCADLDADAARLLALKVRQDLNAAGGVIANARPDSLLELFRD